MGSSCKWPIRTVLSFYRGKWTYETVDTSVDDGDLDLSGERLVLALLEELSETGATREQEAGRGIEIGTELSESSDFTVLRKVKFERTSELLHDLAAS